MIEVLVWLLISHGSHGTSHTLAQFKTEKSCNEARKELKLARFANCTPATIYIPAPQGGKQ